MTSQEIGILRELWQTLDERQRAAARPADTGDREWTYLPGDRPGLPLGELSEPQRAVVERLLDARHSAAGAAQVREVVARERLRREMATGAAVADDRYWLRVDGEPGRGVWGWRLTGHHLAVHARSDADAHTLTPHFVGAEPAVAPGPDGTPYAPLSPEEALAHTLLHSLGEDQRAVAVAADVAPADILTGDDPVADPGVLPAGIARGDLEAHQREHLDRLVRRHLDRATPAYADRCWADEVEAGLDRIRFAWCGDPDLVTGRYFCVRGSTFLVEYDNTQDDANHAHSVWRHLADDWGDSLRAHHASAHRSRTSTVLDQPPLP